MPPPISPSVRGGAPAPVVRLRDGRAGSPRAPRTGSPRRASRCEAAPTRAIRGTSRCAASAAGSAIRPIQNSHSMPRSSAITPDSGRPMPAPMPRIALTSPSPLAARSGGKVSRMIPNASGKTPPATPWITRPAISRAIVCDSAQTTPPAENTQQRQGEHAALAVDVAELADDRRGDRRRQQEAAEDPGRRRRARVDGAADLRQRRDHERLRERERDARQQEHHEDADRVLDGLCRCGRRLVAHPARS